VFLSSARSRALTAAAAAASALALAVPAANAATGPSQQSFVGAIGYSLANGASVDPPGTNDWKCKPSAAHPRPVILVHGTWENKYYNFAYLAPKLKSYGFCLYATNYSTPAPILPIMYGTGSIKSSAAELAPFVDKVLASTGKSKVDIVGHSQGGMMPRAYIKYYGGASKVANLVSLSGSQNGTTLDGIGTLGKELGVLEGVKLVTGQAAMDQVIGSPFITALNADGMTVAGINYTAIATKYDEVVTPYTNSYITDNRAGANVTNIGLQNGCGTNFADHLSMTYSVRTLYYTARALGVNFSSPAPCDVQLPVF
jgi:triacylglycerol esterase/lipase EstA (alpha/beta hydrolase family)